MASAAKSELASSSVADSGAFARRRRFANQVLAVGELGIGALCFAAVLGVRHLIGLPRPLTVGTVVACGVYFSLCMMGAAALRRDRPTQPRTVHVAAVYSVIGLAIYPPLFLDRTLGIEVSRLTLLLFEAATIAAVIAWYQYRAMAPALGAGRRARNLAVVGSAATCRELASALQNRHDAKLHTLAVDAPAHGGIEEFEKLLRETHLDEVLLAPELFGGQPELWQFYQSILDACERSRIGIHVCAPPLRHYDRVHLDHVGGRPVLSFEYAPDESWPLLVKRVADVVLASLGLLLASPLLALAGLAIVLDSSGPVLFRQTRAGLRGRQFTIYKLRTMVADAETRRDGLERFNEMSAVAFKMSDDPRITRVGKWLRKSSLDEVPQLYNVLRGDMSFVGPRPPIPSELERYQLDHLRRLAMKPGITGLWQVSGRNEIKSFERWVELDTQYIRTWSLGQDLTILLRTVWAVVRMTGK